MLWAIPSVVGAGVGAVRGYKKGGIPGAIGGAVVGALPWNKWKAAGLGFGFLSNWLRGNKDNLNVANYSAAPEAAQFAKNYAAKLKPMSDDDEEDSPLVPVIG
tara:strand:+ start:206 stop:514 length:309 start_codon:yes stop_codon:yes gene_type:complete